MRRLLRGAVATLPVYVVDEQGCVSPRLPIELVAPQGCYAPLDSTVWPMGQDGWWDGLPYPLYDMRPQGYLGRLVARAVAPLLHVPDTPDEWADDDILYYLIQHGSDQSGNLIVGEQALQLFTRARTSGELAVIAGREVPGRYVALAQAAVGQVEAGSSAGGEFPKFTAARELAGAATPHVIVKFSGSDDSAAVRRWSDLLVCEHLALEAIARMPGHAVARSRILQHAGRTFIESERFDRHGDFGRSAVVTLSAIEGALIGSAASQWPAVLRMPAARGLFAADLIRRVEELHWFGRFIANTDMHHGNLSFRPRGDHFDLAPAYDMLPMSYAPLRGGEVPVKTFAVETLPLPPQGRQEDWRRVVDAALGFWQDASRDDRIGPGFRNICAENRQQLQAWADVFGGA